MIKPASDKQLKFLVNTLGYTYEEVEHMDSLQASKAISESLDKQNPRPVQPTKIQTSGTWGGKNDNAIRSQVAFKGAIELASAGKIALDQIKSFTLEFTGVLKEAEK